MSKASSKTKVLDPKKCQNCQRVRLLRPMLRLCPKCFMFADTETQVVIASTYDPQWEWAMKAAGPDAAVFSEACEKAVAQAAIGTIKVSPMQQRFADRFEVNIQAGAEVWVGVSPQKAKVLRLITDTHKVVIRYQRYPPDVIEVDPSELEVIQNESSIDHPED